MMFFVVVLRQEYTINTTNAATVPNLQQYTHGQSLFYFISTARTSLHYFCKTFFKDRAQCCHFVRKLV